MGVENSPLGHCSHEFVQMRGSEFFEEKGGWNDGWMAVWKVVLEAFPLEVLQVVVGYGVLLCDEGLGGRIQVA